MQKIGRSFGVVINRQGIGNDGVEQYCREEGIDILGRIPDMKEIAHRYARGGLIHNLPAVKEALRDIVKGIGAQTPSDILPTKNSSQR
jgi:MinD superfamily P-loop ATPase